MTETRLLGRRSRRLAVLLLAVTGAPAVTLVWLGLQLLLQERSLQAQRGIERQQAALGQVIRALEASLADAGRHVGAGPVPDGMTRLTLAADGVGAEPADRVLWLPVRRLLPGVESRRFADAERLEFQGQDVALASYQEAAQSPVAAVRAGALLRAARVLRRQRKWDQALSAYERLARIDGFEIEGAPSDLQARRAFASVLEDAGRVAQMRASAVALEADLLGGRWALDRPAWELATTDLARWLERPVPVSPERAVMSEVAHRLWQRPLREFDAVRRSLVVVDASAVTVLIEPWGAGLVALAIAPATVQVWADRAGRLAPGQPKVSVGGSPAGETGLVNAPPSDTGLPWTVAVGPIADASLTMEFQTRRRLLAIGLVAILLLLGGGSYFLWRVVEREVAVARLQTDFVAAVSHELRTPLTALRHVTELLAEGDEMPKQTRAAFYDALGRNTDRLHRLVESLLDFARMESGRKPYDPQPLDAGALASDVVADFRTQHAPEGVAIEVDLETPAPRIRADRASLSTALWNLLDNAIKYSPAGGPVRVSVRAHPAGVAIAVGDRGLGVPPSERAEIFQRFVRGEQARRLGIKGTGLGLAMASHIAEAHGGHIELDSEEGAGSTFRLVLPAMS
jgi:signal transduction histidine kinase